MTAKKSNKTNKVVSRESVTDGETNDQHIDQEFVEESEQLEQAKAPKKEADPHAEKLRKKRERWSKMTKEEIKAEFKQRLKNFYAKQSKNSGADKGGETEENQES